ncbi:hypothetical protein [Mesorhizobium sp. 131-2-1]|uniref:hypothetical protein n=1 Tax=Mesorhizobium sp. 131-2-1 TaxID=2744518 RepID=UPI001926F81E|nr:hypothetical protein [Mesorhizobium sp. 131-2-1]
MRELLDIFGDVMRIVTFQWRGEGVRHAAHREDGPTRQARWSPAVERHAFRRSRP